MSDQPHFFRRSNPFNTGKKAGSNMIEEDKKEVAASIANAIKEYSRQSHDKKINYLGVFLPVIITIVSGILFFFGGWYAQLSKDQSKLISDTSIEEIKKTLRKEFEDNAKQLEAEFAQKIEKFEILIRSELKSNQVFQQSLVNQSITNAERMVKAASLTEQASSLLKDSQVTFTQLNFDVANLKVELNNFQEKANRLVASNAGITPKNVAAVLKASVNRKIQSEVRKSTKMNQWQLIPPEVALFQNECEYKIAWVYDKKWHDRDEFGYEKSDDIGEFSYVSNITEIESTRLIVPFLLDHEIKIGTVSKKNTREFDFSIFMPSVGPAHVRSYSVKTFARCPYR